jgi:RNA-directed DNA polymerase
VPLYVVDQAVERIKDGAFSIPDAALANIIMWRARNRNLKRLSPYSYAYHPDRNVFDAVLALAGFVSEERLFAVQIDFEKYFDSIPASYLKRCVDDAEIVSLTPHERYVLQEFLYHQYATPTNYLAGKFSRRVKGTPQGSSGSLLLANLANHELDRALERRSGRFVRLADDVVALCGTYEEAQSIEKTFSLHCASSGLVINEEKSPGIGIIQNTKAEIRSSANFDYLGYRFTKDGLTVPDRVKKRIIGKLSRLIHIYLIHYPSKFGFNSARCGKAPDFDWDLLGLISEIRGYLYGGLNEKEVVTFLFKGQRLRKMRGLMGFYALLERKEILQQMDGWLVNNIRCAMVKRNALLLAKYGAKTVTPSNEELILGNWLGAGVWKGAGAPEVKLPSFVRGWRAARKHYYTFGLEDVEPPSYGYYS